MRFFTFLIPLLILLSGCVKNEFTIDFDLPDDVNSTYRLIYYASDSRKGSYIEVPAPVTGGKFSIRCITRNPTVVYVFKDYGAPAIAFYAERDDKIKITGDGPVPSKWQIKGNDISEKWSRWRLKYFDDITSGDPVRSNKAVEAYIKGNTDDPLSTLLMLNNYDRRSDEAGFLKLWNMISEEARNPSVMDLSPRADLTIRSVDYANILKDIYVTTYPQSADTLRPSGAKATFYYFRQTNDDNRQEILQQIRDMVKLSGDSSSRLIAEISLDIDSLSWVQTIRTDSLKNVVKAWLPLSFANEKAIDMGVDRTPFFIVADKKGKQIYRGDNPGKASELFLKSLK